MEKIKIILTIGLIVAIGVVVFWKSFQLGIYGDEWKIFWLAESSVHTTGRIIPVSDSSYGFEIITFYLLSKVFGYDGWVYYGLSFGCRIIAALTLFWFLKRRKFRDITAFVGSLVFIVTPIGIETTDWVRNFDSYLGVALFLICTDAILTLKKWSGVLTIVLSFALAALVNSIRSHGLLLGIWSLLLLNLLVGSIEQKKLPLVAAASITAVFVLFGFLNIFGGQIGMTFFAEGFQPYEQFKSLFGNFGNSLVPNVLAGQFYNAQLLLFWIVTGMILIWKGNVFWGMSKFQIVFNSVNIFFIGWLSFLIFRYPADFLVSSRIGLYIFIILFVSAVYEYKKKHYEELMLTSLVLVLGFQFMFMPSIRQPTFHASFDHRYLTYNALVIPLVAAFFWNSILRLKRKVIYMSAFAVFALVINFSYLSQSYLELKNSTHNHNYTTKMWTQMRNILDEYDLKSKRYVLYFTSEVEDQSKTDTAIIFDYNSHVGLIYQIWDDNKTPMWVINEADLKSAVTDGESIYRYIKQKRIIPKEDIIYFHIAGDKVIKRDIQTVLDK